MVIVATKLSSLLGSKQYSNLKFWSEVRNGLKPAKIAQKTEIDPPRKIPQNCYDTNDGFYNPKALTLVSPSGELLRVPVCEEDIWIKKYCRKGFSEPADFRPDLFENWYNNDEEFIQLILRQQDNFRKGKITYNELQQFYADNDLLPSWSKYRKRKSSSTVRMEEYLKSIPEPKVLRPPKHEKKFEGHQIPWYVIQACNSEMEEKKISKQSSWLMSEKKSKSFIRFHNESKPKLISSQAGLNMHSSRISFKLSDSSDVSEVQLAKSNLFTEFTPGFISGSAPKMKVPERFLKSQPILRPPFQHRSEMKSSFRERKKCPTKDTSRSLQTGRSDDGSVTSISANKKILQKFMKSIIMDAVNEVLLQERQRLRQRLVWAKKVPQKSAKKENVSEKCLKVFEELFESIPDREEYCDSDPKKTCDLRKLAEDKYNMLKYWGKRMFTLEFEEDEL